MSSPRNQWKSRLLMLLVLAAVAFFAGPPAIHFGYRSRTSETEQESNRQRYRQLAAQEAGKSTSSTGRLELAQERLDLLLWFHVRGLDIDEGGDAAFLAKKVREWKELFAYWKAE